MAFRGPTASSFRHPTKGPGFGATQDAFAGIAPPEDDDDDGIDFEDTYDGLGDQLDEADDAFNDDTFGGGGEATNTPPRKDFDFFGQTNKMSDARPAHHQRPSQDLLSKYSPAPRQQSSGGGQAYKTGYERYQKAGYVPDLQVDPSLWGMDVPSEASAPKAAPSLAQKKMMSLEEVEAAMRSQPKKLSPEPGPSMYQQGQARPFDGSVPNLQVNQQREPPPKQILQPEFYRQTPQQDMPPAPYRQQQPGPTMPRHAQQSSYGGHPEPPDQASMQRRSGPPQILQRPHVPEQHDAPGPQAQQPLQILQNPQRRGSQPRGRPEEPTAVVQSQRMMVGDRNGAQIALPVITHPSQLANLTEEQRQAFIAEDARRAKRNHKIYLLSKGNGLMTPQDKNFITRIQLQQLMAATTGGAPEGDPDVNMAEDFYYQVYNQIEHRSRQSNPQQPARDFAQTYLFQTGGRHGMMNRRQMRGDNHMHRMQQQVQRAVEAAKAKPKNKQLVIEGSLGKISFSNAKTPKPLVNISRNDKLPQSTLSATDRKAILKNIEAVYSALMKIEDHDRHVPQQAYNEDDPDSAGPYVEWRQRFKALNATLWSDLKVMEPIHPESTTMHPFIAFLSYPKGKKAIPRIFANLEQEQRLTILTSIMIQLDSLDVVRSALPQPAGKPQSASVAREQEDLFIQAVMPALFSCVTEAPLSIIMGLVGLLLDRVNITAALHSRVGVEMLTMLLSQAEIIRKSTDAKNSKSQEWQQWLGIYNRLFDTVEPLLSDIFPKPQANASDVYVWQFLATLGTGATPEQHQRLVLGVKDRVMETLQQSKQLPREEAAQRRANVNLFMQAIGLDVDLLDN